MIPSPPVLDRRHTGRPRKRDILLTGAGGRGSGRSKSTTARKPCPLYRNHSKLSGFMSSLHRGGLEGIVHTLPPGGRGVIHVRSTVHTPLLHLGVGSIHTISAGEEVVYMYFSFRERVWPHTSSGGCSHFTCNTVCRVCLLSHERVCKVHRVHLFSQLM